MDGAQLKSSNSWIRDLRDEYDNDPETLAEYWKLQVMEDALALMERTGMQRRDLADRLGVSNAYISKLFEGTTNVTIETMAKMANAVDGELSIRILPKKAADKISQRYSVPFVKARAASSLASAVPVIRKRPTNAAAPPMPRVVDLRPRLEFPTLEVALQAIKEQRANQECGDDQEDARNYNYALAA